MPHDLIPLETLPPGALTTVEIDTVRRFAEEAQAASTRRAYEADWAAFRAWAVARDLAPLPAEPATIAAFLAAEAEAGRKVSTIGRRVASIRHAHKLAGIDPSPTDAQLVRVTLKGVRRSLGVAPTRKTAATAEVLSAMLKHIPSDTLLGLRDRALLLVGLGCALRRSELVALRVEDLTTTKNGILVNVRRSKTDTEGRGYEIPLLRGVHLCPCEALEA